MSEANTANGPGYGLKVTAATLMGSVAAGAFWAAQNLPLAHAERLQEEGLAAGLCALVLAYWATKGQRRTPRRKPEPAPRESRASPVRATLREALDAAATLRSQFVEAAKTQKTESVAKAAAVDAAQAPKRPSSTPSDLETERARLRTAGFSDAEISQILVARETGAGGKASFGSGVATGLLNNVDAIVTHVRGLVPSFKGDLTRMLDRDAGGVARIGGALSLGVKAAAIVVVGYFVYLEAVQFRASAYKAWAEACIARQQAEINFSSLSELMSGHNDLDSGCKTQ